MADTPVPSIADTPIDGLKLQLASKQLPMLHLQLTLSQQLGRRFPSVTAFSKSKGPKGNLSQGIEILASRLLQAAKNASGVNADSSSSLGVISFEYIPDSPPSAIDAKYPPTFDLMVVPSSGNFWRKIDSALDEWPIYIDKKKKPRGPLHGQGYHKSISLNLHH